jgi:steroid delta-isomerase-like uncharacterized protein
MTARVLVFLALIFSACSRSTQMNTTQQNSDKERVAMWYQAFDRKEPQLLDQILSDDWVDIPSPPGTPPGPAGVKPIFARLTTTFPDLKLTIEDILQDGNKVVVRARMTGTQEEAFMDFPSKNRKIDIQVVDIHEVKDGKIIRTWHTEDWMNGLRQLGVFEK